MKGPRCKRKKERSVCKRMKEEKTIASHANQN